MNRAHHKLCSSAEWQGIAAQRLVPSVLEMKRASLGNDVLELGPGFGATTLALAKRLSSLSVLELDPRLANQLRAIVPDSVEVIDGDASRMPFESGRFSGVLAFTMLHHVSPRLRQDKLFAEVERVLQPGGVFAGTDPASGLRIRLFHLFDTFEPLDARTLPTRLERAGFSDVEVHVNEPGIRFLGVKPGTPRT